MKILAVSDIVMPAIYSPRIKEQYANVDLVVACGDLPYYYLEYIVTLLAVPLVYVHGNHDTPLITASGKEIKVPRGCISLESEVKRVKGLLMAGLGGSIRYRPDAEHQYTEGEMAARILRLVPRLLLNRVLYGRYLDILVTHSPPRGIHDGEDRAHQGFKSFLTFMRYFEPAYLLHGHQHVYRQDTPWQTEYEDTTVVNVFPKRVIEGGLEADK